MNVLRALKVLAIVLGVIIIVLLGVLVFYQPAKGPTLPPDNVGGAKIATTTPVVSSDGHVSVTSLHEGDLVSSPLTIAGTVVNGGWFFEAIFPVKVIDGDGAVLGSGPAHAQGDWMTTGTVPFVAEISFTAPHGATGTVVLSKDNPSGDPKYDLSLVIPVRFK